MAETRTVKRLFNQVAEWYPENTAFVQAFENRQLSYAAANERARQIANGLAARGVDSGDRVALLADPSIEHAIVFFAAPKIGAVTTTLHVRESVNDVLSMVREVDPSAVVFDSEYDRLARTVEERHDVDQFIEFGDGAGESAFATPLTDVVAGGSTEEPAVDVSSDDRAFINYTSGSTGRPKGIVHTHEETVEACHAGQYLFAPTDADTMVNASTPSFIAWKILTLPFVNVGGTVVFVGDWQPERIPDVVREQRATVLNLVPTQWKMVVQTDYDPADFDSLRLAGYGGEAMGADLFEELRANVTEHVTAQFGTTETMHSGLALLPHRVTEETLESIGRPVPSVDVRIIEPDSHDPTATVDPGTVGELIIRGPSVAETVWRDPETTAELFHEDGWWFSGDLAVWEDDGNVYLKGRTDNMIITGGINVYAEAVEGIIEGHPGVTECAVIGVPDETWGEAVTAYVVPAAEALDPADLDDWCRSNDDLADYQRPRTWSVVESLPRTNTGKLDRSALRSGDGVD